MVLQRTSTRNRVDPDGENKSPTTAITRSVTRALRRLSTRDVGATVASLRHTPGDGSRRQCVRTQVKSRSAPPSPVLSRIKSQTVDTRIRLKRRMRIRLPSRLVRPAYREVSKEAIRAVDDKLPDVSLEYIRDHLEVEGPMMLEALKRVRVQDKMDRLTLPQKIDVRVEDASPVMPTHVLAIYNEQGPPSTGSRTQVKLFPTHHIVLAAHCANLPSLPVSVPLETQTESSTVSLPVVPLNLPSPSTFPTLCEYLYTRDTCKLFESLFPCPPPSSFYTMPATADDPNPAASWFSQSLAQEYGRSPLLRCANIVIGLWRNACTLGMFDPNLWRVLDLAWEIILCAIADSSDSVRAA